MNPVYFLATNLLGANSFSKTLQFSDCSLTYVLQRSLFCFPLLRFIFAGALTTLLSQALLIFLLNFSPIYIAVLVSQFFHATLGYFFSSKMVFSKSGRFIRYGILFFCSWLFQWIALSSLIMNGWSRLNAISAIVPVMALSSYLLQRNLVFR